MKDNVLNEKATHINVDLINGFIYATDQHGIDNYFQACIVIDDCGTKYKRVIDSDDCGYDWGICGDYNASINADTEQHLREFLHLAKKNGIKII